jgi:hypothetical protein
VDSDAEWAAAVPISAWKGVIRWPKLKVVQENVKVKKLPVIKPTRTVRPSKKRNLG